MTSRRYTPGVHHPLLVLRTAPTPPPSPTGDVLADLRARQRHAHTADWLPANQVDPVLDLDAWVHGGSPTGLRMGLCFVDGDGGVALPHPAPGEISATTGLTGDTVTPWLRALALALRGQASSVHLDAERFVVDADLRIRALDPDGTEESCFSLDPDALALQLASLIAPLPALVRAAEQAGHAVPLRLPDLTEAVRVLLQR